jgi:hypothetical protein
LEQSGEHSEMVQELCLSHLCWLSAAACTYGLAWGKATSTDMLKWRFKIKLRTVLLKFQNSRHRLNHYRYPPRLFFFSSLAHCWWLLL